MKVKIGNKIYTDADQPIMVILTDFDKQNISQMPAEAKKYLSYPDTMTEEEAREFMKTKETE